MKITVPDYIPGAFRAVFQKPFTEIPYEKAPELIGRETSAEENRHVAMATIPVLGKTPTVAVHRTAYQTCPDQTVNVLKDPLLLFGVVYSRTGGFFRDSVRLRDPAGAVLELMRPQFLNLGNRYYVLDNRLTKGEHARIDTPSIPFFSQPHFGHYLTESIPHLWPLTEGYQGKLTLPVALRNKIPGYVMDMIRPFGLDETAFVFVPEAATLTSAFLPTRPCMLRGRYVSGKAVSVWHRIGDYYRPTASDALPPRIYASRRKEPRRRLLDEEACEALFREKGFTVIYPEDLSFRDQIALFSNATHIAGPVGSAMHLSLFNSSPELKMLYLAPKPEKHSTGLLMNYFWLFDIVREKDMAVVYGKPLSWSEGESDLHGDWNIDMKEVEIAINQWLDC